MELTHASFFSGVGGLDLGLERAGWRTVSFSEIDPYASAVLAERWPGVPNLGDITSLRAEPAGRVANDAGHVSADDRRRQAGGGLPSGVADATLWSGGFPCQDLSVAGKRAGFTGQRSILAFTFLDLVERHRPPAILLENVPGLLSSNGGKDFGRLLGEVGELGYWWAYRILDAQFFGVPQRRRRVFICALDASRGFGADSAAAVLSVGTRCDGHSAAGDQERPAASDGLAAGISRALSTSQQRIDADTESFVVRSSPDSGGNGKTHGLARWMDHGELPRTEDGPEWAVFGMWHAERTGCPPCEWRPGRQPGGEPSPSVSGMPSSPAPLAFAQNQRGELRTSDISFQLTSGGGKPGQGYPAVIAATLNSGGNSGGFRTEPGEHLVAFRKSARVNADPDSPESWVDDGLANTLNGFDVGDVRTTHAVVAHQGGTSDDGLLPLGLDSHRYRCCGNGVVSNVSEWIGWRLRRAVEGVAA